MGLQDQDHLPHPPPIKLIEAWMPGSSPGTTDIFAVMRRANGTARFPRRANATI
jgi:hypothetical protein